MENTINWQPRINRAKELLKTVRHASMATVDADGSPRNTPFFFMYDDRLKHIYWGSHPESEHSKNIARTGKLFVALYDGNVGGGLFIQAANGHATSGDEFTEALEAHNQARARFGMRQLTAEYYASSPQQIYKADIQELWVNDATRDKNGMVVRDFRHGITVIDLLD